MSKLISSLLVFLLSFVSTGSNPNSIPVSNQTTIIFTGDIMLGRSVMGAALDNNDPFYPFRKLNSFLSSADITFSNLENPITENCKRHVGGFTFCTTPEIAKGLKFAGIDVVTLANNHSENYGKEGLEETKSQLTTLGIKSVGYGNLEKFQKNEIKFGFLGFNYTFNTTNLGNDLKVIKDSDSKVDILIVGPHWGDEYKSIANNFQVKAAHSMIDSGADVVIGHHPHWVQNFEEINGKPVYYSLGNFIFDQMWSEETRRGLVMKLTYRDGKLVGEEKLPIYMQNFAQPEWVK